MSIRAAADSFIQMESELHTTLSKAKQEARYTPAPSHKNGSLPNVDAAGRGVLDFALSSCQLDDPGLFGRPNST